ncbi:unnamed protein product [Leuciscus chuanchicus]
MGGRHNWHTAAQGQRGAASRSEPDLLPDAGERERVCVCVCKYVSTAPAMCPCHCACDRSKVGSRIYQQKSIGGLCWSQGRKPDLVNSGKDQAMRINGLSVETEVTRASVDFPGRDKDIITLPGNKEISIPSGPQTSVGESGVTLRSSADTITQQDEGEQLGELVEMFVLRKARDSNA